MAQSKQIERVASLSRPVDGRQSLPAGHSLLEQIGNTPLLHLANVGREFPNIEFYAKAEWFNPGGSVKDRPALSMIQAGISSGLLERGKTIIDATSGNTGIAYAMIGAAMGYAVKLCLPESASVERKRILRAYGAELVTTPGDEGTDGAIRRVREIVAEEPAAYYYPDQYSNPANWEAHYRTTAAEIWEQTGGEVDAFRGGIGDERNLRGDDAEAAAIEPGDSVRELAAGFVVSRAGRLETYGDGAASGDLRRHAGG